ncbi:hypothetical protein PG999_013486 [Apiospora kogelbergensis]|uniref:Uncharacterized protein n=1 Tax=Apiospora kogelbergensis TaxID=1337665 RepID=A0AAW0QJZ6_9PEZI
MTDHYRRSRLRKLQKRLVYDAKYMSDAIVSWLTFENGKDVNEASGAAVVVTTGEAATDVGATGLSRTATGVLGVAEIDLFHRPVEVPSVATATDTYRKTDVADVAVVRRPDQCLPTPEARPHGLGPALARFPVAGVVAGGQAHGRSLHRDGTIDPVDHRLVAKRRASGQGLESEMTRPAGAAAGKIHRRLTALLSRPAADIRRHQRDADIPVREVGPDLPLEAAADDHAGRGLRRTLVHAVAVLAASPSGSSSAAVVPLAD